MGNTISTIVVPKQQVYVSSPVLDKKDVNLSNDDFEDFYEIENEELVN